MQVFLTGASGFIGSRILAELVTAGHQVTGLARSESSAQALKAAGPTSIAVRWRSLKPWPPPRSAPMR